MKTTKKKKHITSLRLSAHQASNVIKTGRMWEFHHQTGGDRTGLPAHRLQHKLIHKKNNPQKTKHALSCRHVESSHLF